MTDGLEQFQLFFGEKMDSGTEEPNLSPADNKHPVLPWGPQSARFGSVKIEPENVHAGLAVTLLAVFILTVILRTTPAIPEKNKETNKIKYISIDVSSSEELISNLKKLELWELAHDSQIPPVFFTSFPPNIHELSINKKKRAFFHTLLPAATIVLSEIAREKDILNRIMDQFGNQKYDVVFTDDFARWGRRLTKEEINFIFKLTRKYRTTLAAELLNRVDLVPVSLILAQGALESSWGTSRFAQEGNNIFGIWTWGERGMVPSGRETGKRHKLAIYDTTLDAVRAYVVMLNRLPAYRTFRKIRRSTMDSLRLTDGLLYYSERRGDYVTEIQNIIKHNDLTIYDQFLFTSQKEFDSDILKMTDLKKIDLKGAKYASL